MGVRRIAKGLIAQAKTPARQRVPQSKFEFGSRPFGVNYNVGEKSGPRVGIAPSKAGAS
jgi:hypothetical protein